MDRLTIILPKEIKQELQIIAIKNNTDMTTILLGLIRGYLNGFSKDDN